MISRLVLGLVAAALLLVASSAVAAAEYHVATIGNDGAAGSLAAPYRTLRHALDVAGPGDKILLHAGTYGEQVNTYQGRIRGGTSWTNALVIAALPGDTVVLQPPARSQRVVTLADARASYVVIRGLVLDARNVGSDGVKITWSGTPSNTSHHIRIEDSEVVNAPGQGLMITAHHNEFLRLRVHLNGKSDFDHGFYIAGADNLIDGCEVFQNAGWGVNVYNGERNDADRNVVRNNRVHHNARIGRRGAGIILSSGEDNVAFNNVVFGNQMGIHVDYGAANSRVYNNTVFAHAEGGIHIGAQAQDTDVRNNLVFRNTPDFANRGQRTGIGTNLIGFDPGIVDPARFDAHLRPASGAIDKGTTLATVPSDADGVPRPQGAAYDVGAYEYRSFSAPTVLPPSE